MSKCLSAQHRVTLRRCAVGTVNTCFGLPVITKHVCSPGPLESSRVPRMTYRSSEQPQRKPCESPSTHTHTHILHIHHTHNYRRAHIHIRHTHTLTHTHTHTRSPSQHLHEVIPQKLWGCPVFPCVSVPTRHGVFLHIVGVFFTHCGSVYLPTKKTKSLSFPTHEFAYKYIYTDVDKIVGTLPLKKEKPTMVTEIT